MSFSSKVYPEMRSSGIEWLGDIPRHWELVHGRACFRQKRTSNKGLREKTVLSLSYGKIVVKPPEKLHGLVPASFETYQIVDPMDIIIRPTDLQNDQHSLRIGFSSDRGIITSAYLCFNTSDRYITEYGYLLLHAYDLLKVFYGRGSGLRQNLDWSDFRQLPCPIPPVAEQSAIARFLDHMNHRIASYIQIKERLIALLEEYRQGLIHQATSGQIDVETGKAYAEYKDSGVAWMGSVPKHWKVSRLRAVSESRLSNVDKLSKGEEIDVRLCNYLDVYRNDRINGDTELMAATATEGEIARFKLRPQDVLITKDSETWNDIGVPSLVEDVKSNVVCGYHLALIRPRLDGLGGTYLFWTLQSPSVSFQMHIRANGVTRFGLTHNAIKSVRIPIPPITEQSAIARFLDRTMCKLSKAISDAKLECETFSEYRIRLIADVVTGKLDVREAANELPNLALTEGVQKLHESLICEARPDRD